MIACSREVTHVDEEASVANVLIVSQWEVGLVAASMVVSLCVSPCLCSSGLQLRCFWAHCRLTSIKKIYLTIFFSVYLIISQSMAKQTSPDLPCASSSSFIHPGWLFTTSAGDLMCDSWNHQCEIHSVTWVCRKRCCCLCCQPLINISASCVCVSLKSVSSEWTGLFPAVINLPVLISLLLREMSGSRKV